MSGVIYPINDRKYTAEDVEIFNCTRTSGVFSVLDFDCSLSGNVVTIGKGLGWLKNGDFSGKAVAFKDITSLTLDGADSAFDRYDVVAVRYDATKKDPEIIVIKGEASESPVMPKRSTESYLYELFLYSILRKAGESTASFENVTDLRENKNYCGIMEDSVTSAVAPVYETIVENTELKVNDKLDFDYEKYEYLIATLRMSFTDCDVILTKSRPSSSGVADFHAFSGVGSVASGSSTFYFRAQIRLKPNSATGHSVASSQWLNNPNFTAPEDNATIIKIVGVTKQPKGYVAVDDVYNAESHNAQSGQAISMALSGVLKASKDYTRIYVEDNLGVADVTYDPTSDNAQSGKAVAEALVSKQDALIDGENIKTINGQSILGSGNIVVEGAGGTTSDISSNQVLTYADYYDYEIIDSSIMNLAGNVTTASNFADWWVTNHIYCAGMTSIEYQAVTNSASASNIAFFDSTKKFISGQATGTSADVPDGAFYVRFCGHINYKNDFYVKFHSTKTVIERLYEAENTFNISKIPDGSITRQKLAANFMSTGVAVMAGADANNLLDVGDYLCYAGVLNTPSNAPYGISVRWYKGATNSYMVRQTAIDYVSGDIYERLCQVSKPATEWLYNFTEWKDIINDHSKPLEGKTILLFGDSITVLGNVIANKIIETTGAEVINCGFSGCRMARHGTDVYSHYGMAALAEAISANNFTEQENNLANAGAQQTAYANTLNTLKATDFSTVDFVSIAYGTNDWNANVPLKNDENEFDTDTFEGALRYALKELYTKNPLLRINVCTPLYRFVWSGGNVTDDSDTKTNTIGLKLTDYITSLENVCAEFHAQVIDLYNETGFNKYTAGAYFPSDDGTHPNIAGRELVGKKIAVEIMHNNGITE